MKLSELRREPFTKSTFILSLAGAAGGFGMIASSFVYAFTHGSSTVNRMESVLGMDELAWGRLFAAIPLLLWAGLLAFRLRACRRWTGLMAAGFWTASSALALRALSELPQFFLDLRVSYSSPLGIAAWLTLLISLPVLSLGMILIGEGCRRADLGRSAVCAALLAGLSILPTFLAGGMLASVSEDGTMERIAAGALAVPQGLAWAWFSLTVAKTQHSAVFNRFEL